jgi:hypothetical protein
MLRPVLIFGSGVHYQWLLDEQLKDRGLEKDAEVLRDWGALLRALSVREGLLDAFSPTLCREMPTLQWEELAQAYCQRRGFNDRAHEGERDLKNCVADILLEAEARVEAAVDLGKMFALASVLGPHTLSLNMDTLFCRMRAGRIRSSLNSKEEFAVKVGDSNVWFPHGSSARRKKITFGVGNYGDLPSGWREKFGELKVVDREIRAREWNPKSKKWYPNFGEKLAQEAESKTPETGLMAYLMCAPLKIFGASLSGEEWGMWWLLNQRARNLVRVPAQMRPTTEIFIDEADRRLAFWAARPANIRPIITSNWDNAWSILIDSMGNLNELAGEVL